MSQEKIPQESPARLTDRLDYLENSLRDLIVRVYTIEQKLGLRLAPVEQPKVSVQEEVKIEAKMPEPTMSQAKVEKDAGTVIELEPKKPLSPPVHRAPTIKELIEEKQKSQVDIVSIPPVSDKREKAIPLPRPEPVETIVQPLVSSDTTARRSLESMIGGKMFAWIGIIAVILSGGLFLRE